MFFQTVELYWDYKPFLWLRVLEVKQPVVMKSGNHWLDMVLIQWRSGCQWFLPRNIKQIPQETWDVLDLIIFGPKNEGISYLPSGNLT